MSEDLPLISGDDAKPTRAIEELEKQLDKLFAKDTNPRDLQKDIFKEIADNLRTIEKATCGKFDTLGAKFIKEQELDLGDFAETMGVIHELKGWQWLWRVPSLLLTVIIASLCIPLAALLEDVISEHPILGGFPPAISAAAGCIGIQNTSIIIRGLGLKLVEPKPIVFMKYLGISFWLSAIAAVIEAFTAWLVVSIFEEDRSFQFNWAALIEDVPVVIFFSMLMTGFLAGAIGSGIPLFVVWVARKTKAPLDPAHWVGPIETVVQEFCATLFTFGIADVFVFTDS